MKSLVCPANAEGSFAKPPQSEEELQLDGPHCYVVEGARHPKSENRRNDADITPMPDLKTSIQPLHDSTQEPGAGRSESMPYAAGAGQGDRPVADGSALIWKRI